MIGRPDRPLICTPLSGRTRTDVMRELSALVPEKPDLIEWRADSFEGIGDIAAVIDLASDIKAVAGNIPIIFACRTLCEGGGSSVLNDSDILKLYVAACASRCVDVIDYELSNSIPNLHLLRQASRDNGVTMVMSYHNPEFTPDDAELSAKFMDAERLGADVAKVVVMPNQSEDVLALLATTLKVSKTSGIPLVSISMGCAGSLSRIFGWLFGSVMTFAEGKRSSVPGQLTIKELRSVLASVRFAA